MADRSPSLWTFFLRQLLDALARALLVHGRGDLDVRDIRKQTDRMRGYQQRTLTAFERAGAIDDDPAVRRLWERW